MQAILSAAGEGKVVMLEAANKTLSAANQQLQQDVEHAKEEAGALCLGS